MHMQFPKEKMQKFYPGVYTPEEQAAIDRFRRGETGAMFGSKGPSVPSTDQWVMQLYARCWDRWNPLFNDPDYAKQTVWGNLPAMPGYISMETRNKIPPELGYETRPDGTTFVGDGYDHTDEYYAPVFPGDQLTARDVAWDVIDVTPKEGSIKRRMIFINTCEVTNQDGVVVARCIRRWPESLMRGLDDETNAMLAAQVPGAEPAKKPEGKEGGPGGAGGPGGPGGAGGPGGPGGAGGPGLPGAGAVGGGGRHASHIYTREDYDKMVEVWKGEKIRGAEPLYWEDVNIGDEPAPVCSPPQVGFEIVRTIAAWQIMKDNNGLKEVLTGVGGDPHFYQFDPTTGLYRNESGHLGLGSVAYLYNFHAKCLNARIFTNWCGDQGFVTKLGWRFVNDAPKDQQYNHFPADFYRPTELLKVPYMKDRYANSHGYGDDAFITRAYVVDKYIGEDGGHYVDLIAWCEDFDGNIGQEIPATVKLPSRTEV